VNDVTRIPSVRPVIRKAERRKSKLRLALVGPTGSGKTFSALQLAFGLGSKVGLIDTEHGSGDLYADLGDYDVITLEPPYTVAKYRDAIRAFEEAGYDTIIVDSLSHAWSGEGGLLDKQGQLENSGKYRNSFATWRETAVLQPNTPLPRPPKGLLRHSPSGCAAEGCGVTLTREYAPHRYSLCTGVINRCCRPSSINAAAWSSSSPRHSSGQFLL
jgi:SpoVK/Ycf46/Vps4 family AAA+-type ATPase